MKHGCYRLASVAGPDQAHVFGAGGYHPRAECGGSVSHWSRTFSTKLPEVAGLERHEDQLLRHASQTATEQLAAALRALPQP